jgi:acyl-CoA synthetase (AMP-forming)/AMP-acid ligase II
MDDERWGQMVVAAVVGDVDDSVLRAHLAERLAAYKLPKRIEHVAALPHSPTGKLRRGHLAEDLGLG